MIVYIFMYFSQCYCKIFTLFSNVDCCFRQAVSSPVIVQPEVCGGINVDGITGFLILMSDGLYKSVDTALNPESANVTVASMVAREFEEQTTLNGVAQAVVDKIVRHHHDAYLMTMDKAACSKREDITLLVRNFNYSLKNSSKQTPDSSPRPSTQLNPFMTPLSVAIPAGSNPGHSVIPAPELSIATDVASMQSMADTMRTLASTHNSDASGLSSEEVSKSHSSRTSMTLDEHGRCPAYVDFTCFYDALEELSDAEREELENELAVRPDFETIPEEKEPLETPTAVTVGGSAAPEFP